MLNAATDASKEVVGAQLELSQRVVGRRVRPRDTLLAERNQETVYDLVDTITYSVRVLGSQGCL